MQDVKPRRRRRTTPATVPVKPITLDEIAREWREAMEKEGGNEQ